MEGYPKKYTLDPRHDTWLLGIGPTVFKMAKYWSVSPTYGKELMDLIVELEEWWY
ncbi:hypothetical protein [Bacteroides sp. 224]|uniref:hypothetical protein n=1 Tax=Bacteroides sp. 224 TaxID=2302936 RepID=UPI0013D04AF1|nr:hypothetical protein [Bacteroides sp. 224]